MYFVKWLTVASGLLLLLAACTDRKEAAEQAVVEARNSVAAMREDAARYAPDELARAENSLGELERNLAGGEYDAVIDGAPELKRKVGAAAATVAGSRKAANHAIANAVMRWNQLDQRVPPLLALAEERAKAMSKKGSGTALADTEAAIAELRASWLQAGSAFASGRPEDAVQQADQIERRTRELLQRLGVDMG
jgi:hypothetical protein